MELKSIAIVGHVGIVLLYLFDLFVISIVFVPSIALAQRLDVNSHDSTRPNVSSIISNFSTRSNSNNDDEHGDLNKTLEQGTTGTALLTPAKSDGITDQHDDDNPTSVSLSEHNTPRPNNNKNGDIRSTKPKAKLTVTDLHSVIEKRTILATESSFTGASTSSSRSSTNVSRPTSSSSATVTPVHSDEDKEGSKKLTEEKPPVDAEKTRQEHENKAEHSREREGAQLRHVDEEESSGHFMAYFIVAVVLVVTGYLVYHNKQKVLALFLEGKRATKRQPNGKEYRRLKTSVDEAMPSLDKSTSGQNYVY